MSTPENSKEQAVGLFIRQHLNAGVADIRTPVAERIFDARRAALARHALRSGQPRFALAGYGVLAWAQDNLRPFLLASCLITLLAVGNHLMSLERIAEIEEVDSALLSDDLPIDAYLDKGFDAWLADSSQR